MAANRIQKFAPLQAPAAQPPQPAPIPHGFMICPGVGMANAWQMTIYLLAYQRAKAAMERPLHHRRLFAVWN